MKKGFVNVFLKRVWQSCFWVTDFSDIYCKCDSTVQNSSCKALWPVKPCQGRSLYECSSAFVESVPRCTSQGTHSVRFAPDSQVLHIANQQGMVRFNVQTPIEENHEENLFCEWKGYQGVSDTCTHSVHFESDSGAIHCIQAGHGNFGLTS